MLRSLFVKDFAIVREAEVAFAPGLTVVSGETGAGKSLLVDALLLLSGGRADSGMVRHGANRAELSAEFELSDAPAAADWLAEQMLDEDGLCTLRRVIAAAGGSRAWINGRPATATQLSELGARLVEVHGQHEHQLLLERRHQLAMLDAFGDHAGELEAVRAHAQRWAGLRRELAALAGGGEADERADWIEHQLRELDAEALAPDEIEAAIAAHRRHANAATLIQGCERALATLAGDEGYALAPLLARVRDELDGLSDYEPRLAEVLAMLESASIQIDEAARSLDRVRDDLELDPEQLAALEARLARLHDLARKHRVPLEALAARRAELAAELESLRGASQRADQLRHGIEAAADDWRKAAGQLGAARASAAAALGESVTALMAELGMRSGRFVAELQPREGDAPDPNGAERTEFLVSANPDQPPRPLRKVASGGELSRISLAIEVAALGLDSVPTMVFDEVDAGIGGAVAEVVGRKLRELGARRQALCVTHLPQVAAQGHAHLRVHKSSDGGSTRNAIEPLGDEARIEELSRMLGGVEITAETRAHARQMLERGQQG